MRKNEKERERLDGGCAKKKGQDRHPARFNPISYEKPIYQTVGASLSLHAGKKKAPIEIAAVSIQYSMKINYTFQNLCQSLPLAFKGLTVSLKGLLSVFAFAKITHYQFKVFWLQVTRNWLWPTVVCRQNDGGGK